MRKGHTSKDAHAVFDIRLGNDAGIGHGFLHLFYIIHIGAVRRVQVN